jgi:hypothetical protein
VWPMAGMLPRGCSGPHGRDGRVEAEHFPWPRDRIEALALLNVKIISPLEVIRRTLEYWTSDGRRIGISQVEVFTRQILGWPDSTGAGRPG